MYKSSNPITRFGGFFYEIFMKGIKFTGDWSCVVRAIKILNDRFSDKNETKKPKEEKE